MSRKDFDVASLMPTDRLPSQAKLFDPSNEGPWRGALAGEILGGPMTILAYGTDRTGEGPGLHVHPYDEVFVVTAGHARFYVGDITFDVAAGQVVLGPAGIPHRFENLGPGRLQTIDIHHSPRWIQTDL